MGRLWQALQQEFALLKQEMVFLKKQNAEFKERLNRNSNNSSKPPSMDRHKKKKKNHKGSGRHSGGQPGHPGISRKLVPIEQVDTVTTY